MNLENSDIESVGEKVGVTNQILDAKCASDHHKRSARILEQALTLGDHSAWSCASALWEVRLTAEERAALAWAALKSLQPWQAEHVAETVLAGAGLPMPPLSDVIQDARFWAEIASPDELRAYILAAYYRLPPKERRDFHAYVGSRAA